MRTESFVFSGAGGKHIDAVLWLPECDPVGVIQIAHGMTEHVKRWEVTAKALTDIGIAVTGFDMRGHGADIICPDIAAFGENGWHETLEDVHCLFLHVGKMFPDLPYMMMGLSLGAFILREYFDKYPEGIAGAALLGTGQQSGMIVGILQSIIKTQIRKVGYNGTTPLVHKVAFETYNAKFKPNRTSSDWLCSDEKELDSYISDPLSRTYVSAGLFWNLLGSMKRCSASNACKNWNRDMSVLLLSGMNDPVGGMGKDVAKVQKQILRAGIKNAELRLVPDARHDILHEEKSGAAACGRTIICDWVSNIIKSRHPANKSEQI